VFVVFMAVVLPWGFGGGEFPYGNVELKIMNYELWGRCATMMGKRQMRNAETQRTQRAQRVFLESGQGAKKGWKFVSGRPQRGAKDAKNTLPGALASLPGCIVSGYRPVTSLTLLTPGYHLGPLYGRCGQGI
jgi:hypothetical protein